MLPYRCLRREGLRECLLVVCFQRRPVGLASSGDWRDSCSCFESIPSVIDKSLICKGTVVPTNDAKLMVLSLSILGWSLLKSLGQFVGLDQCTTCKKGRSGGGMPAASPMPKSVSSLRKGERSTVRNIVIAYLSLVELLGIYHG